MVKYCECPPSFVGRVGRGRAERSDNIVEASRPVSRPTLTSKYEIYEVVSIRPSHLPWYGLSRTVPGKSIRGHSTTTGYENINKETNYYANKF